MYTARVDQRISLWVCVWAVTGRKTNNERESTLEQLDVFREKENVYLWQPNEKGSQSVPETAGPHQCLTDSIAFFLSFFFFNDLFNFY